MTRKSIQQHTLIQTISRVNRVYEGKDRGLIVDYIGIKKNMNIALRKYTNYEKKELDDISRAVTIGLDQLEVLDQMFCNFSAKDYYEGSPVEQLNCLNRAVEYVQLTQDLEVRFMAAVKKMKQAFNLCSSSEQFTNTHIEKLHFYQAVRSILFKLTKGSAPDISQMNAKVRKLLDDAIQSDGIEELFETGKHEEKAFYDILLAVSKKYAFEYPNDKMIELSKEIRVVVDDKAKYTDWSTREDIKATLQVDLIILLDKYGYPPVTIDDVYKEVLEQAENFKKYAK